MSDATCIIDTLWYHEVSLNLLGQSYKSVGVFSLKRYTVIACGISGVALPALSYVLAIGLPECRRPWKRYSEFVLWGFSLAENFICFCICLTVVGKTS